MSEPASALEAAILKAIPLASEALVHLVAAIIRGRALADACNDAALMIEQDDADPGAFNQREQAERDPDA
jgi:hypothetical protein